MLATGTIAAYQSLSKTIAIIDDGKVSQYETFDVYVGEFLDNQGIQLGEKDTVSPAKDAVIENGMKITINRWHPIVNISVNGEMTFSFRTTATTVEEALKQRQIEWTDDDEITPSLNTKIEENLEIVVKTREVILSKVEEEIPFEIEVVETTNLSYGEEVVEVKGQAGKKETTVEIVRFGGELVSETVKEVTVVEYPTTEVVKKGIANAIVCTQTGKSYQYTKELTLEATAYTDIPGDRWYGITASGAPTFVGMVAVDPNYIPLGTKLYVEGYGVAIAGDTGGAIKGYKIDLFFDTSSEVYQFGRRNRQVYILEDQSIDVISERAN
jgi:uncharacterized protein YabE (DUF348 family)